MKIKVIILMLISLFLTQACGERESENCHKVIVFKNTTSHTLYVVNSSLYPDTLSLAGIPDPKSNPDFTKVLPNENNMQVLRVNKRDCTESIFEYFVPSDTLMVYVFDAQVLETTPWDTVKSNYLVLKRYDLTLDDVRNLNWTITYPPTENMKNIKMYPPYEE